MSKSNKATFKRGPRKAAAKKPPKASPKATAKAANKATQKTAEQKKPPAAAPAAEANVLTDDQQRAIFLNHCTMLGDIERQKKAVEAVIKAEGSDLKKVRLALKLLAAEERPAEQVIAAEKKLKNDIESSLRIARWVGSDLGVAQIDWLEGATPAVDRAYDEGKMAGLRAQPRKPNYDPSVPQYASWMKGYDDGRAVLKTKFRPPAVGAKAETKAEPKAGAVTAGKVPEGGGLIFEDKAKAEGSKASQKPKGGGKKPPAAADGAEGPKTEPTGTAPANASPAEGKKTLPEPEFFDSKSAPVAPQPPAPPDDGEPATTELVEGKELVPA